MSGTNVLLPIMPLKEGDDMLNAESENERLATYKIINSIINSEAAGYAKYSWPEPGDVDLYREKISYTKVFTPLNWLIGTGDYVDSFAKDLRHDALKRLKSIHIGESGFITVFDTTGNLLYAPNFTDKLIDQTANLEEGQQAFIELKAYAQKGGGFSTVNWQSLLNRGIESKLSFVERIDEYDWIIAAGTNSHVLDASFEQKSQLLQDKMKQQVILLMVVLALTLLVSIALVNIFNRFYKLALGRYQTSIESQKQNLEINAKQLMIAGRFFDTATEGIIVTDPHAKIIAVNPACCHATGYSEEELIGCKPNKLASGRHDKTFYQKMWKQIESDGKWLGETWNKRKNGETYPQWLSISVCRDPLGNILNYVATFSDISENKNTQKQLQYLAQYDPLTELANSRLLIERAEQTISHCKVNPDQQLALMFIDLDRFKNINDSLGHAIGDKVLQLTAKRLLNTFRSCDTVCRLGGDEFIVLIQYPKTDSPVIRLSNRMLKSLADPLHIDELDLVITTSIGIAVYPENGKDYGTLMKNADAALYHAKSKGRNNVQFFTKDMHLQAMKKLSIERGLRRALKNEEFEMHYQAQYSLTTGRVSGCEALLRWRCPEKGLISPDDFISIAEETGIIVGIGKWVLEQCCKQSVIWQQRGFTPLVIAVNVSGGQFNQDLLPDIRRILQETGLSASLLSIEVTESALMSDPELTRKTLLELQKMGVKVALDDFGTGYSSLAYLKKFPIDKLKIDRAFIDGLVIDADETALALSIIDIARNLKLETIAEGVETQLQYQFLQNAGCGHMQGFLKAKPLTVNAFEQQILSKEQSQSCNELAS